MTNKEFAEKDEAFKEACAKVNLPATKRQASKWRRGFGLAYKGKEE
jgi:hypothetical protein